MNQFERLRASTLRLARRRHVALTRRRARMSAHRSRRRVMTRRRRIARIVLALVTVFSVLAMTGIIGAWAAYSGYAAQLPDAQQLAAQEPSLDTHVYAADGSLLHIFHDSDGRHEHIALSQVSRWVVQATVDTEDRHFYQEASLDLPRIAKAAVTDVRGGATQGASTITEQLAKISFLPSEKSIDRKIKQLILGNEIASSFSKDQILDMYLNRIPYGNYSTGIATAADLFFHKSAHDLDLAEASLLAGLPQSPSYYDPIVNDAVTTLVAAPDPRKDVPAKQRQHVVLQAMVANGDISQKQADAAYAEKLVVHPWNDSEINAAPDFVHYLEIYLQENFGNQYLHPGGWNIYTSLEPAIQHAAEGEVNAGVSAIRSKNGNDGSLVSMNPTTGAVVAMVGTWNYSDPGVGQLDMAIQPRQPGSTIKVFTYSAAIASRVDTMTTTILDAPVTLRPPGPGSTPYSPLNYDLRFHGNCPLKICLGNSFNVPAVKTEVAVGIPYITDLEIAAGLTSLATSRPGPYDYAATLGALAYGISPLDMADGVSTIADMGVHHDPAPITKITNALNGTVLFQYDPAADGRQVLPADAAFIISEITSNDQNRWSEFGRGGDLTLPGRRVSAKTGTTQFFTDNWTVGWTPTLATAVWVGNPTQSCLKPSDRPAFAAALAHRGDLLDYSGVSIDDPFSPQDLARYGFQPVNDHCGHLVGSTGITGAAPIWHRFMVDALNGVPVTWYTKPADVIERGTGDDGDFYMPGTINQPAGTGAPPGVTAGCWYWAPAPNPSSSCQWLGPGH